MKEADVQKKAREMRLEYMRNWRKNNRERLASYQRVYWLKRAEKELRAAEGSEGETTKTGNQAN